MLRRFLIKCIIFLFLLAICLPFIYDAFDSFNGLFSSTGYELGVDLSIGRLLRDPGRAVQEILDSIMQPLTDFDNLF